MRPKDDALGQPRVLVVSLLPEAQVRSAGRCGPSLSPGAPGCLGVSTALAVVTWK